MLSSSAYLAASFTSDWWPDAMACSSNSLTNRIITIIIIINIDINNSNNIYFLLIIIIIINEITVETSCFFRAELVSLAAVFCLITQHSSATKEEERCVTRQKWLQELAVLYHNCSN